MDHGAEGRKGWVFWADPNSDDIAVKAKGQTGFLLGSMEDLVDRTDYGRIKRQLNVLHSNNTPFQQLQLIEKSAVASGVQREEYPGESSQSFIDRALAAASGIAVKAAGRTVDIARETAVRAKQELQKEFDRDTPSGPGGISATGGVIQSARQGGRIHMITKRAFAQDNGQGGWFRDSARHSAAARIGWHKHRRR
jgi:hypothetical protein